MLSLRFCNIAFTLSVATACCPVYSTDFSLTGIVFVCEKTSRNDLEGNVY